MWHWAALTFVLLAIACDRRSAEPRPAPESHPSEPKTQTPAPDNPPATLREAPELRVSGWLGDKSPLIEGRPRLVVGWTTWCAGCVAETPFLTALAKKYAGKVDVFGLSDESLGDVRAKTEKMAERVAPGFPIASDVSKDRGTLSAHFGRGAMFLPQSWLVHEGRIVWSGSPSDAVAAMEEVVKTGDAATARKISDELPDLAKSYRSFFASGGVDGAKQQASRLLEASRGRASFANEVAWDLLEDDKGDAAFATQLARVANDASLDSDFTHLDTYALGLWKTKKRSEALGVQEKAIELCNGLNAHCNEERQRLEQYRSARK